MKWCYFCCWPESCRFTTCCLKNPPRRHWCGFVASQIYISFHVIYRGSGKLIHPLQKSCFWNSSFLRLGPPQQTKILFFPFHTIVLCAALTLAVPWCPGRKKKSVFRREGCRLPGWGRLAAALPDGVRQPGRRWQCPRACAIRILPPQSLAVLRRRCRCPLPMAREGTAGGLRVFVLHPSEYPPLFYFLLPCKVLCENPEKVKRTWGDEITPFWGWRFQGNRCPGQTEYALCNSCEK